MKLMTFLQNGNLELAVKYEKGVLPLRRVKEALRGDVCVPLTVESAIREGALSIAESLAQIPDSKMQNLFVKEEHLQFGPCVQNPGKIICVGLNYRAHALESGMAIPEYPVLFSKFSNALTGHKEPVFIPEDTEKMDYEAELAVVIGKTASHVSLNDAIDYVFGYCNANDLSARDLQFRTSQWLLGKCCDGFCPLGPYLVTTDEVSDLGSLKIRCYVNRELRQNSYIGDMIFPCAKLVSYISSYVTLEPGDIILTGTPKGVVFGYPPEKQAWLRDGDEVTVEIDGLGQLVNRLVNRSK